MNNKKIKKYIFTKAHIRNNNQILTKYLSPGLKHTIQYSIKLVIYVRLQPINRKVHYINTAIFKNLKKNYTNDCYFICTQF